VSAAGGAGTAAFLESLVDTRAGGGQCRHDSAEQAGEHGQCEREGHHLPIETDGTYARKRIREEADADAQGGSSKGQAKQAATDAEQERLNEGLAQNGGSAGAKSKAHGDFAAAANDAHQQQSGKVGAGNEEHHQHGKEERAKKRARLYEGALIEGKDDGMDAACGQRGGEVAHDLLRRSGCILLCLCRGHAGS